MSQLFTVLLVFSHFIAGLPNATDVEKMSPQQLVQAYSHACLSFYQQPEYKELNLSDFVQKLVSSVQDQPSAASWLENKGAMSDALQFYSKVCKSNPDLSALDPWLGNLREAVTEYKNILNALPEIDDLHKLALPQATEVLSADHKVIGDIYVKNERRKSVPLSTLPPYVPKIFVEVEDSRFFEHKGIDELGILRAVMKATSGSGARQGASTITQQVARNLYLSPVPTMRRKLMEILLAEKIEKQLSKREILELYLNLIYFGRNSWGIEKASESYFGKSAKNLTTAEAMFLAGVVHGPNLYRNQPERIVKRVKFVVEKLKGHSVIPQNYDFNFSRDLKILPEVDIYNSGYLRDFTLERARKTDPALLLIGHEINTTIQSKLQAIANQALQEGLMNYDHKHDGWEGPMDNIQDKISAYEAKLEEEEKLKQMELQKNDQSLFSHLEPANSSSEEPQDNPKLAWALALMDYSNHNIAPISDWELAVLLDSDGKIGFTNGTEGRLAPASLRWAVSLDEGDIFFVRKNGKTWEIVQKPKVNGAVIIMDTSGKILAMSGGFSYRSSGFNRATQAYRQPGSLMKPFTYLTALQMGIQPNTLLEDQPLYFPPVARGGHAWRPVNYGGGFGPPKPMRWGLENSRNVMTAFLMSKIGLDPIRNMAKRFGVYDDPIPEYPFILGAQDTTLLSMVKAYGEIANNGYVITPHIITDQSESRDLQKIPGIDDISMFQLRYLLQGVVERGTAEKLKRFSRVLAAKTGTSNDSKDVWFIGFTNDLVIGVYAGYDEPQPLGEDSTGSAVALPVFERIFTEMINHGYMPEEFPPPPPGVLLLPTDKLTGQIVSEKSPNTITEAFRESIIVKEH